MQGRVSRKEERISRKEGREEGILFEPLRLDDEQLAVALCAEGFLRDLREEERRGPEGVAALQLVDAI
jgi:hypothetical protein